MKYEYTLTILCFLVALQLNGQMLFNEKICQNKETAVIAHRGAWKSKALPQNSIAALKNAIALKCAGSEFDVKMTGDDSLVVVHDDDYNSLPIETSTYKELSIKKLSNGESLPTLRQYLNTGMENNQFTRLICEIKPSIQGKERAERIAIKVVQLVAELKAQNKVVYISFDYDILQKIIVLNPTAITQFLGGNQTPDKLRADGISGADYHINVFKKNPEWIHSAKQNRVTLNAWTVNNENDMCWFIEQGFDFITTDEPEVLLNLLSNKEVR